MSLILSIETGTDICSVALSRGSELVDCLDSQSSRNHATKLALYIEEILKNNGVEAAELSAVAVSKGPGSYTGLRIGVSTAKGLCYALGIPLIAVGSLESLANVALLDYESGSIEVAGWSKALLCPMIDARRMEVYAEVFSSALEPQSEIEAHILDESSFSEFIGGGGEFLVFGDGAEKSLKVLPTEGVRLIESLPSARGLVAPAWRAYCEKRFEDVAYFEPFYLKDFVVTRSKKNIL